MWMESSIKMEEELQCFFFFSPQLRGEKRWNPFNKLSFINGFVSAWRLGPSDDRWAAL